MTYNMTFMDEAVSFAGLYEGVNTASNGLISSFILLTVFIIMFFIFKDRYDTKVILLGSSFITTLLASLFWAGAYIGINILLIPIGVLVASIILYLFFN